MNTSLYRHFAADGSLLYVGISMSWPTRTKAHVRDSRWFDLVARVEIERFPTREDALEAERVAIKTERPQFNIIHNKSHLASRRPSKPLPHHNDPLLKMVAGPDAIVGPALEYRDGMFSIMVAHGQFGSAGNLSEIILGCVRPEASEWASHFDTVISISRSDDMCVIEASEKRDEIIKRLEGHLDRVEAFDSDLSLAIAYASRFPSSKSLEILEAISIEKRRAA